MVCEDTIRELISDALYELDRSFGRYDSGKVVSGNKVPSYKDVITKEDPLRLTQRVLVNPVMVLLGYSSLYSGDVFEGRVPRASLATVSMNSVMSSASARVLCAMNADDAPRGIATDGFRWLLAVRQGDRNRVCAMSDLRPYYIEVLDRDRFREAVPESDDALSEFIRIFSSSRIGRDPMKTYDNRSEEVSAPKGGIDFAILDAEPLFDAGPEEVPHQYDVDDCLDEPVGECEDSHDRGNDVQNNCDVPNGLPTFEESDGQQESYQSNYDTNCRDVTRDKFVSRDHIRDVLCESCPSDYSTYDYQDCADQSKDTKDCDQQWTRCTFCHVCCIW